MKVAFLVILIFVFLFATWLMWRMTKGAVEAGKAQNNFFRKLRGGGSRRPPDDE